MKKFYLVLIALLFAGIVSAQEGIQFDPNIDIDFSIDQTLQVPKAPIIYQELFVGGHDSALVYDSHGNLHYVITKENNDFVGVTPDGNGDYWITINHESNDIDELGGDGGGMTVFKVTRDPETDALIVVDNATLTDGRTGKYFVVDFKHTVGETRNNCGGIIGPNGEIWTAEEYPPFGNNEIISYIIDVNNWKIGTGSHYEVTPPVVPPYSGETIKRYQNMGWMVRIDPANAQAVVKQYNWGRMSYEGGVLMPDNKTVYLMEDGTPGLFTKFVADVPGDFLNGTLYCYKHDGGDAGNWITVPDDLDVMLELASWAWENGATMYNRMEWNIEIGGLVYCAETGRDNPGPSWIGEHEDGGQYAPHHVARAVAQGVTDPGDENYMDLYGRVLIFDPATDEFTVYLEGGPEWPNEQSQEIADYPDVHISNVDGLGKVNIGGTDFLILCEDLNGSSYNRVPNGVSTRPCEMYLLDVANTTPDYSDLIRVAIGPWGAELTGGTGLSDGKSILVNVQHPSSSNPAGSVYPYESDYGVTEVLTGFDKLANVADANFLADFSNESLKEFRYSPNAEIYHQTIFVGGDHKVQYLDRMGKPAGEITSKENNDFIGYTADGNGWWISINHERLDWDPLGGNGGGMTSFYVERDPVNDTLIVMEKTLADGRNGEFFCVDFINTVGETRNNCGGIIGPNGEIWTAEEYPPAKNQEISSYVKDTADWTIGVGGTGYYKVPNSAQFNGEVIERYQNMGWMVHIDPAAGKATQKQYNWGRMSFEGGCLMPDEKTVYLAEDGTPGLFTKFVANTAGDFNSGKLYCYKHDGGTNGNWIEMDNNDLDVMLHLADNAWPMHATMYNRLEWIIEIEGKVYIAETGRDNPAGSWIGEFNDGGQFAPHHIARAADQGVSGPGDPGYKDLYGRVLMYDPQTDEVTVLLESGPEWDNEISQPVSEYPSKHVSNVDGLGKITVNGKHYMLLCEDLNGWSYNRLPDGITSNACELYILDMEITEPTIDDLSRISVGPYGAELTGATGTFDGKSIICNVQHPKTNPNGNVFPFDSDYGVTFALTGWDKVGQGYEEFMNSGEEFGIFPNPAFRYLYLNKEHDVNIYDSKGNLVISKQNTRIISISDLVPGVYYVKNEKGQTRKLIVE